MGVSERRQRERQARRKAVLDAARRLVRERGYQGMTTKQIAAECELSEATLFWYFQSKDEIFTSLLFEAIEFMEQRIDGFSRELAEAGSSETFDADTVMRRIWRIFQQLRDEYPEYFHVFTSLAIPSATRSVSDDVRADLVRRSGENFRRVSELLTPGLGAEAARLTVDATWALFVGVGVLHDSRVNLGAPTGRDDRILRDGVDLLLPGLTKGEL